VTHVEGKIDPISDADTVETELMLADMESLDKRRIAVDKKLRGGDKEAKIQSVLIERALKLLAEGKPARLTERNAEEEREFKMLQLLTAKPVLYVCNVDEASAATGNAFSARVAARAKEEGAAVIVISAKIESEIAQLPDAERREYLSAVGLTEPGLNRLIRTGYTLLGLITYFTAGPKEARAWDIAHGTKAPQAAGVIHTDFEKGFIKADIYGYADIDKLGSESVLREKGLIRSEGKEYTVKDGDVCHFKFAN
jgi:GTP-binding protein YchF